MREALIAVIATVFLLPSAEAALPASAADLGRVALGQINFDGLDMSGDNGAAKKKKAAKKKDAKKKDKKKSAPHDDGDDAAASAPASTPAASPAASPSEGLDLSKPAAAAAEPPKKEKAAPVQVFDAMDVSGKSAERQKLDEAIRLIKDKNTSPEDAETAARSLAEMLSDPKMAGQKDEVQFYLAKALFRLKMYHSALNHFRLVLAKGPSSKFFKSGLEWLFHIAHQTVNEGIVLDEVAKWSGQEFPDQYRSEFRYLLARYYFARGKALDEAGQAEEAKKSIDEAKKLIGSVNKADPFYAKVKYLEGTIYFKENSFAASLESYKEVVRANNPRSNPHADVKMRELAFMQLARTHYGHKQNRYAIFYYDKVQPGSEQWLEALFEASWAHFRIGAYERALGNMITLSSPFFKDEYFPEALILKAVIYYENCRYREARAILEEFEQVYMPVHNELERITAANTDAQGYYDILAEIQRRNQEGGKGTTLLLERILKLALTDKDLKSVNDSILEIEKEMDAVADRSDLFRYSELAKGLNEGLKAERAQLMQKAGILAKAKLEFELGQLKELLGNALRIKFETSTKEKEFLEKSLVNQAGSKEEIRKYGYSVAVNDERVFWPYEGEYWRDELGTYEYTLTKGCKGK